MKQVSLEKIYMRVSKKRESISPLTLISQFTHGKEYPDHDTHLAMLYLLLSIFTRLTWEQPASQNLKGLFDHLVAWVCMAAAYMHYLRKQASNFLETQS